MRFTKQQVLDSLKTVIDPELGINIVDLGLIYAVKLSTHKKITTIDLTMTLTTPGCPLAGIFDTLVKDALQTGLNLDKNTSININLTFDPPWTPDMMTPEARAELGFD